MVPSSGDTTSAIIQYQNDEGVQKTMTTTSVSLVQCETTKCKRETNHNQLDQRVVTITPGSPAFDPSRRYTVEELEDAAEESKRVCRGMQRREAARVDKSANCLFEESDDEESENNSEKGAGSADGPIQ